MEWSTPGFPVHHQLLEMAQTHVHRVSDPTISSSVIPFSCLQSFSASGSFPMSQFFASGGQSIRTSVSASVLPMNIQDWFPLELTGWISLLSKGLSRVFSSTAVQKHHFFSVPPSLWSNSHIHTWPLEIPLSLAFSDSTLLQLSFVWCGSSPTSCVLVLICHCPSGQNVLLRSKCKQPGKLWPQERFSGTLRLIAFHLVILAIT